MNDKTADRFSTAAADPLKRRGLLIGAASVASAGAAVLAIKALPGIAPAAPLVAAAQTVVDAGGGYQATAHVLRYYETARA